MVYFIYSVVCSFYEIKCFNRARVRARMRNQYGITKQYGMSTLVRSVGTFWDCLIRLDAFVWWLVQYMYALQSRHNGRDGVLYHQSHQWLLNHSFRCRWKKSSKPRVTGLCAGNSPVTGEFPAQMASNAENVSIWWRHHDIDSYQIIMMMATTVMLMNIVVMMMMTTISDGNHSWQRCVSTCMQWRGFPGSANNNH